MSANSAMQFGKHAYEKAEGEWYREPRWVVEALADNEGFFGEIWDPAAGSGTIPEVLRGRGYTVHATDIADRGYPLKKTADFLELGPLPYAANVVTNPPFSLAEPFARHALSVVGEKVALLVSLTFLESQARYKLFTEHPPLRVWVCSRRPSMPPGDTPDSEAKGGKRPYCWIVWQKGYQGPTQLCWLPPK